jgi:subtilisin family serine protease
MKRLWLLLLWAPLAAQRVPDHYVVELSEEPAALRLAKQGRRAAEGQRGRVRSEQTRLRAAVEDSGAEVLDAVDTVANALVVRIPDARASRLAALPGVRRVHPVRIYRLLLDRAVELNGIGEAWKQIGGSERAGAGAKIAVLDTGIDQSHPGFQAPGLEVPTGFPKVAREEDKSFTNAKVIVARNYSTEPTPEDRYGHGTAVAMAAAGISHQAPSALISGAAPRAFLGNYKISGANGVAPSSGILRAFDDAVKDGMDVINMSFGDAAASRPSDDLLVSALERAFAAGVLLVIAAGNEGPDLNTIASPATAPSAIAVGASSSDRMFATSVILDSSAAFLGVPGDGSDDLDAVTAPLSDVARLDENGRACEPLPEQSLTGRIALILRGVCYFEVKLNNAQKAGAVAAIVYTDADRPQADIVMRVGTATLPAMLVSYVDGLAIKQRVEKDPEQPATLRFKPGPFPINPRRIASFSSRGPSSDQSIKPDLVAVGTWLYLATQKSNPDGETMYDPSGYITEGGTSFSAPVVAGAAAALKAARPGLTVNQYRSLLINSAAPFAPAADGEPFAVQRVGAGSLDLLAALQNTVTAFPTALSFGVGGGTVDVSRDLSLTNIGKTAGGLSIRATPLGSGPAPAVSAGSLQLEPGASRVVTLRLTATALEPGEYQGFVEIQALGMPRPLRVPYWCAVPATRPQYLTILRARETGAPGSFQRSAIIFRVTERSGVPLLDSNPTVTVLSGDGEVREVVLIDDQVPGAYAVNLNLGPVAGPNRFRIQAGELRADVTIAGRAP